jgi:hypothetical protein
MCAMLLGVVEGDPILQMCSGSRELAAPEQKFPKRPMGFHDQRPLVRALRQSEELLP